MPKEYMTYKDKPEPLAYCPNCAAKPFQSFMRGMVQSWWRRILLRNYCCIICSRCKQIVGYE